MSPLARLSAAARAYLDAQQAYIVALACFPGNREGIAKAVEQRRLAEDALRAVLEQVDQ